MVEEADIVVLFFQRLDFVLDELVEHHQIVGYFLGNIEIHVARPPDLRPGLRRLFVKPFDSSISRREPTAISAPGASDELN
jgi:hypothetical protein